MKSRLAERDNENRTEQDSQIEPERKLPHVLEIILPSLRPTHLRSARNLSEAGDAGANSQALHGFTVVFRDLLG